MKILDLSLTYHWYDMIACGEKKEEYREMKDYYCARLLYKKLVEDEFRLRKRLGFPLPTFAEVVKWFAKEYDAVRFHRGQGGKTTMLLECKGITIGRGKPEWGAPENAVFIIKLGEIIKEE